MAEPLIIRDVRMYPDGKLYELFQKVMDPDNQQRLKEAKESLDIMHWTNIKRMLNDPEVSGTPTGYIPGRTNFKIVKPRDDVAWIVPDESEASGPQDALVQQSP